MVVVEKEGVKVFACAIEPEACSGGGNTVRRAERCAVEKLVANAFGPDISLQHCDNGAPFVNVDNVTVSVSHCRGLALLAVDCNGRAVGVDAERVNRGHQLQRVAAKFLSPEQLGYWSADSKRLLRAWTIKEALYKAVSIDGWPLHDIPLPADVDNVVDDGGNGTLLNVHGKSYRVFGMDVAEPEAFVTVAVEI
jgi:hypothetical protein